MGQFTAGGQQASTELALAARPQLRGVLHGAGFVVACAVMVPLLLALDGRRLVAAAVFAASAIVMLGVSTLYHRVLWKPRARAWMRRADHAGVYLLIAGTYTPVGLLSMHGTMQHVVLAVVWSGAAAAILTKVCWVHARRWISVAFGVTLGWIGIVAMPQLAESSGLVAVALIASGGLAYTAGAIVYALRRPDPIPSIFGYHEIFHALTLVALTCQYVAIAFFVVRVT